MRIQILFILAVITLFSCSSEPEKKKEIAPLPPPVADTNGTLFSFVSPDSVKDNGEHVQRHKNGVIEMKGMMKDGKRVGLWKSWYEDGSPWSETTFREGKKDGKTITWYDNEQKRYEGFYTDDKESGKWKFWDESGQLVKEQDFGK
ncbi:MAG: hypothetical protein M3R27_02005 [Bacteroidota bacterium]|nr:hypothetical protein [Bacteroidota bacterium]